MDRGFSQEKFSICLGPLPSFVFLRDSIAFSASPHCSLPCSLRLSESQLCVVRDHILLTLLQEFWYISFLIDFLSFAIFFIARSLLPLPYFFLSPKMSHSFHTNKLTTVLFVWVGETRKEEVGTSSHFPSEQTLTNYPQTNRKIQVW